MAYTLLGKWTSIQAQRDAIKAVGETPHEGKGSDLDKWGTEYKQFIQYKLFRAHRTVGELLGWIEDTLEINFPSAHTTKRFPISFRTQELLWNLATDLGVDVLKMPPMPKAVLPRNEAIAFLKLIRSAAEKGVELKADQRPPDEAPGDPETFTVARLAELCGAAAPTINSYAKRANVQTPEPGKRNHRYSFNESCKIVNSIIANASGVDQISKAREALDTIQKSKNKPK